MTYGTVEDWRTYAAARGNVAPTDATDEVAAQSLLRASDYIRTRYVLPLSLAGTEDHVVEATYMAADYDLATPGFWAKTFTPAQAKTLTKVDGIQWTVQPNASLEKGFASQLPVSPAIDALFGGTSNSGLAMVVA